MVTNLNETEYCYYIVFHEYIYEIQYKFIEQFLIFNIKNHYKLI